MSITGILLAAGRGTRFDPSGQRNKLLQSASGLGVSIAADSARHMLAVLPRVVAVLRPGADAAALSAQLLALGCEVTICPHADSGMAASLVHGLQHALGPVPGSVLRATDQAPHAAHGYIIALGDMPHVQPSTIQSLKTALEQGAGIAAPIYRGRRGNPVGFSRDYLPQLLALEGDQGARGILKHAVVTELDVDDGGILQDVDTPADLHPKDKE